MKIIYVTLLVLTYPIIFFFTIEASAQNNPCDSIQGFELARLDGVTGFVACAGDELSDAEQIFFAYTAPKAILILVDSNEVILDFLNPLEEVFEFENFKAGVYNVWGVAYDTMLTVVVGETLESGISTNGCIAFSTNPFQVIVLREEMGCLTTSSNDLYLNEQSISIYPNPVSGWLNIEMDLEIQEEIRLIEIVDMTGRVLKNYNPKEFNEQGNRINLFTLPVGIYILRITLSKKIYSTKFKKS